MEHENQTRNSGYNTPNRQWRGENDDHNYGQQSNWNEGNRWGSGQQNRVHYLPDNDDNRNYRPGGYSSGQYGGNQQNQNFGPYENDWGYSHRNEGNNYGSAGYGQPQYGGRDRHDMMGYSGTGNAYGSDYGNRDYGRSQWGQQYGTAGSRPQNRGYGSSSEGYSGEYPSRGRNRYMGDEHNYRGNRQHHDHDRSWWDRTRDEVASWFGDEDAERRRDRERHNDSGPYYGKGPRGYQRSQERIKEDVCDRLSDDRILDASNIEVDVQGNDVILSGNVHSKEEKRRAEDLAERISGVKNVENRLRVDRSGTAGTDTWSQSIGI